MKQYLVKFLSVCAATILLASFSQAQDRNNPTAVAETYLISAKAGGVNFVSGEVTVVRQNGKTGYLLKGDSLEVGDKVVTGATGKAEILLNPGSFVRLDGNSEFEFVTTSLDDLRVKVNSGSAIFEVITETDFKVTVNTPKSRFYILKTGIYRVDALSDGTARVEVWKGKAQLEDGKGTVIKGGQAIEGNNGLVAKFDRKQKDEFELWSKERAKELDKINAKLRSREMNRALMSSFARGSWNIRNSFGLWVRDPFSRSYCFLPFGYGWSSPYGYFYDHSIWSYQIPPAIQYVISPNVNQPQYGQQPPPPYQNTQPAGRTMPAPPAATNPPVNPAPAIVNERGPSAPERRPTPIID